MKRFIRLGGKYCLPTFGVLLLAVTLAGTKPSLAQYFGTGGPAGGFDGYVTTAGCYTPLAGTAIRAVTDLTVISPVGKIPLTFTRIYDSAYRTLELATSMGTWGSNWDYVLSQSSATTFSLQLPQGGRFLVTVTAQDTWQTIPASRRYPVQFRWRGRSGTPAGWDNRRILGLGFGAGFQLDANQFN
jgi:hypothetical protein